MYGDSDLNLYDGLQPGPVYLEDEDYSEPYFSEGPVDMDVQTPIDDEGMYYERISVSELVDHCVIPTLSQATQTVYPLLGLCLVSRITCLFCFKGNQILSTLHFTL